MSFFVNLTKSLADFITKSLLPIINSAKSVENADLGLSFASWRFCNHQKRSKQNSLPLWQASQSKQKSLHSVIKSYCTAALLPHMGAAVCQAAKCSKSFIARTKCGRENCADPCHWPLCPPGNKRYPSGDNPLHNIYEAYWDVQNDNCCEDPCKWTHPHPRLDDIYLEENDKVKRIYTRTWHECPPRVVPKTVCCYEGIPPKLCLRPKNVRPRTACPTDPDVCLQSSGKCPKMKLPCCCEVRKKLKCRPLLRGALKCKRFCTPYPAFSECLKARPKLPPRVECSCLNTISKCEFYAYWRGRIMGRAGKGC